jgi:hypothetical protein
MEKVICSNDEIFMRAHGANGMQKSLLAAAVVVKHLKKYVRPDVKLLRDMIKISMKKHL